MQQAQGSPSQRQYLEDLSSEEANRQEIKVFDADFPIQALADPKEFLSKYHQNMLHEPTFNQQCLTCCGTLCMACSPPFGLCGCTCCCIYNLPTSKAGLVQVFGKFSRLLNPGINLINPCSQQVREVDLRLKAMSAGRHPTITKDQVKVDIDASLSFRVDNPIISYYILGVNLNRALIELTVSSLRDVIGQYNLDELLVQRFVIANKAQEHVIAGIPPGIKVHNVFIDEIVIPAKVQHDLTSAARQKRLSEALIISNKADVESAALMRESAALLDNKAAMQIRYLQMVKQLGQSTILQYSEGVLLLMDIGVDKKGHA